MRVLFLFGSLLAAATTVAQTQKASDVADFVSIEITVLVINHVGVIDGTGAPAKEDQAVLIANGKIQSIGPAASAQIPQGARRTERSGNTVIPGSGGNAQPSVLHRFLLRASCRRKDRRARIIHR